MLLTPTRHFDDVVERRFTLDDVPGVLWTPASASPATPCPLVVAGLPGGTAGLSTMLPRLRARAASAARAGLATATLELPGSGDRTALPEVDAARADLQRAIRAGGPVPTDAIDRLVLPLVDAASRETSAPLEALLDLPEVRGPVGLSGGVAALTIRLAATEPRVAAAVIFADTRVPFAVMSQARDVTIPTHMLLQWDDETNDRDDALALYDALGSSEKTLTANLRGHTGVPAHAGEAATAFLVRHLTAAQG